MIVINSIIIALFSCFVDDYAKAHRKMRQAEQNSNSWIWQWGTCLSLMECYSTPKKIGSLAHWHKSLGEEGLGEEVFRCHRRHRRWVAGSNIKFSVQLRSLGVTLDQELTFDQHVRNVVKVSNFHIHALRHNWPLLTCEIANTVACSIVSTRLDYCNSLLYGTSQKNISKLQRVQNSLARVDADKHCRREHIRPVLRELHWLPIVQLVEYKVALSSFKMLHLWAFVGDAPKSGATPQRWSKRCFSQHANVYITLNQWSKGRFLNVKSKRFSNLNLQSKLTLI